MNELIELDKEIFLALNDIHAPWLDGPIYFLSNTLSWIPMYVVILYFLFRDYGKETWVLLFGIAITVVLSDQITSSLMKPLFERLRPSRDPALEGLVHHVNNYRGGLYGFASSHAANTFGVATFLYLLYRKTRKWFALLFIWAAFVSYTRIYLGVHYPGDLIAGGIVGALCAWISFRFTEVLRQRYLASSTNN